MKRGGGNENNNLPTMLEMQARIVTVTLLAAVLLFSVAALPSAMGWFSFGTEVQTSNGSVSLVYGGPSFVVDVGADNEFLPGDTKMFFIKPDDVQAGKQYKLYLSDAKVECFSLRENTNNLDWYNHYLFYSGTNNKYQTGALTSVAERQFFEDHLRYPMLSAIRYKFVEANSLNDTEAINEVGLVNWNDESFLLEDNTLEFSDNGGTPWNVSENRNIKEDNVWLTHLNINENFATKTGLLLVLYFDPEVYMTTQLNETASVQLRNSNAFMNQQITINFFVSE